MQSKLDVRKFIISEGAEAQKQVLQLINPSARFGFKQDQSFFRG